MISIVLIGDELLSGAVEESNLHPLILGLTSIGYSVGEVRIVPDVVPVIAQTIQELAPRSSHVITVGGIGPTHDDRTLEAVAMANRVPLITNTEMLTFLEGRYGTPLQSMVRQMADLPEGTEITGCTEGRWPLIRSGSVFVLPGLPMALRDKITRLLDALPHHAPVVRRQIFLSADESAFADWLDSFQDSHQEVTIGSYPVSGGQDYATRLDIKGETCEVVYRCAAEILQYALQMSWFVREDAGGCAE
jgi:molybdopterin-biosynthesis enzyme MoeA-like protein